jgi:hypothetical protein
MNKAAAALLCAILAGCASGSGDAAGAAKSKAPQPNVTMVQLVGPADLNYPPDRFDVQFGVRIENKAKEEITLKQIYLEPLGAGGPYRIRRDRYFFKDVIPPLDAKELAFWAHALATGTAFSIDANAPVTLRATLYFDAPSGPMRKVVLLNLPQGR